MEFAQNERTVMNRIGFLCCISLSAFDFFEPASVWNRVVGVILLLAAVWMLLGKIDVFDSPKDAKKSKVSVEPLDIVLFLMIIGVRGFLYNPMMQWLLPADATALNGLIAAAAFAALFEVCILIIYFVFLRRSEGFEGKRMLGFWIVPIAVSVALVLPRVLFAAYSAGEADAAGMQLSFAAAHILLLAALICMKRIKRGRFEKTIAALFALLMLASFALMLVEYITGMAKGALSTFVTITAVLNIGLLIFAQMRLRKRKMHDNVKKGIGWAGFYALLPAAGYIVYQNSDAFYGTSYLGMMAIAGLAYCLLAVLTGKITVYIPEYRTVKATCGKCGKRVSAESRRHQRCPHCGTFWDKEFTRYE